MALSGLAIPVVLAMTLVALTLLSLSIGRADLPLPEVVEATFGGGSGNARIIVQQLRLPRTPLAILSGASLGLAGAVLHYATRWRSRVSWAFQQERASAA